MNRRTLAVLLAVLGAAAIALGVLSATVWRASNVVTMATAERPQAPVLTTAPGMLDLLPGDVEVTLSAEQGQDVTAVIARTEEVEAWVGGSPHTTVTGAADWQTLATDQVPLAEGATETVPSPAQVDGWPVLLTETGTLRTTWAPEPGRWSLLAVTDGTAPAPQLSLSWQREVATPWLWPGVVLGVVLLAAAALVGILGGRRRRREPAAPRAGADRAATTVGPAGGSGRTGTDNTARIADDTAPGEPPMSRRARRDGGAR